MANEIVMDMQEDFSGGQDASKDPHLVKDGYFYAGVNVSTENGTFRPRWGEDKKRLTFPTGGVTTSLGIFKSYETIFKSGKFQAAAPYSIGGTYYIAAIISGQLFLINQDTFGVQVLTITGDQLNSHAPRINWSPAAQYLTYYDYPAFPLIVDGVDVRRSDPEKKEIPVSNIAGYNQNRVIIGNAGNQFTAGDPVGNLQTPGAPITFEEFLTPNSDFYQQVFELNTNYNNDPITAIAFLQLADTGTGIGPLLVATQQAIYSYRTQDPRETWTAGQFGSILTYNAGIVGPRAFTNVNSDLFFISNDGQLRSLSMSRDEQGTWSKTPVSKEVRNWLIAHDKSLLKYSFVNYFKNKIFMAVNPYRVTVRGLNDELLPDYVHGGFAVMELDNTSTLSAKSPPSWAGLWTGLRPMEMVVNNDRCFVFSKDGGTNELYEFLPDRTYDTLDGRIRPIKSKIYTRAYECQTRQLKHLHSVDLEIKQVKGKFKCKMLYKPDQGANFAELSTFEHDAPWRSCKPPYYLNGLAGANFLPLTFAGPAEPNRCDPVSKDNYQLFKHVELCLEVEGLDWEIGTLTVKAIADVNYMNRTGCHYPSVPVPLDCNKDWAIGDDGLCR